MVIKQVQTGLFGCKVLLKRRIKVGCVMANKRNILRLLFGVVAVGWMILIFFLSNTDGVQSDQIVSSAWNGIVSHNLKAAVPGNISKFRFSMRDWGHVYLFAALGLFVMLWSIHESKLRTNKVKLIVSGTICFLYSVFDEIHQIFVAGRSFECEDLIYDFIGYSLCIIVVMILYWGYDHARRNTN